MDNIDQKFLLNLNHLSSSCQLLLYLRSSSRHASRLFSTISNAN